jgi:hypothetical protein
MLRFVSAQIRHSIRESKIANIIMSRQLLPVCYGPLCQSRLIQTEPYREIEDLVEAFGPFMSLFLLRAYFDFDIHTLPVYETVPPAAGKTWMSGVRLFFAISVWG